MRKINKDTGTEFSAPGLTDPSERSHDDDGCARFLRFIGASLFSFVVGFIAYPNSVQTKDLERLLLERYKAEAAETAEKNQNFRIEEETKAALKLMRMRVIDAMRKKR